MSGNKICLSVLLLILFSAGCVFSENQKGDLLLSIEKVKSGRGYLSIALCSDSEQYYTDKGLFRAARIKPEKGVTDFKIKDIPYGKYSLKVYHDKNSNDKLDKGFFGIPSERYGFSKNPKIRGGMPAYEETVFEFLPGKQVQTIRMR